MPKREERPLLVDALLFTIVVVLIRFWMDNGTLTDYSLQLTALIVIVYFGVRLFLKTKNLIFDFLVFTSIILLIVSSTNGLGSPFFFLIYLLIFCAVLIFDISSTLALTLALVLFFSSSLTSLFSAVQLFSLLIVAPVALFFGQQYLKLLESKEKIKILKKKNIQQSAISNQLSANVANEESNTLLWLTLDFKNEILKICHLSTEMLTEIGRLNYQQKEKIERIYETAKSLLKSGEKLKEKVDRETD